MYKDTRLRAILTLTPETYAALKRAAKASNKTIGALASELVEEVRPVFEGLAGVMENAKEHRVEAMLGLEKLLSSTATQAGQLGLEMGDFRRAGEKLNSTVAAIKKKKKKGARAKST
jgi:hypothetical protein